VARGVKKVGQHWPNSCSVKRGHICNSWKSTWCLYYILCHTLSRLQLYSRQIWAILRLYRVISWWKIKVFPKPLGPQGDADLCSLSHQPGTSLHCETTVCKSIARCTCLRLMQLSLVLTALTHQGMARLSWHGWLVTYWDALFICVLWWINIIIMYFVYDLNNNNNYGIPQSCVT